MPKISKKIKINRNFLIKASCFLAFIFVFLFSRLHGIGIADAVNLSNAPIVDDYDDGNEKKSENKMGFFGNIVTQGIAWIFYAIFLLVSYLFNLAMVLLDMTLSQEFYEKILFAPAIMSAVNSAWEMVRDFFNMFFILILLLIGISKILNVSKYGDTKNFIMVVTGAIMVNFSKPITLVVIDASQMLMSFFLRGVSSSYLSYSNTLAHSMQMGDIFKGGGGESLEILVAMIVACIFMFIMTVMIFTLALSLIFRVVAFWVLIVLSPLAFFAMALPGGGGKIDNGWSQKLLSWAFFGPILIFFLWLSLFFLNALTQANIVEFTGQYLGGANGIAGEAKSHLINIFKTILPYVVAIYLLYYGFDSSLKYAGKGASFATTIMGSAKKKYLSDRKTIANYSTLGLAGAAGYGASRLKNSLNNGYIKPAWEGLRDRDNILNRTFKTKKKYEEDLQKTAARTKAFASGGGSAMRELNDEEFRKKVAAARKEMKELNLTDNEKEEMLKNDKFKDKYQAAALALDLAEAGKLNNAENYKKAFGNIGPVGSGTRNQFDAIINKKNLHGKIEHDIAEALEEKKKELQKQNAPAMSADQEEEFKKQIRAEKIKAYTKNADIKDLLKNQDAEFFKSDEAKKEFLDAFDEEMFDEELKKGNIKKSTAKILKDKEYDGGKSKERQRQRAANAQGNQQQNANNP